MLGSSLDNSMILTISFKASLWVLDCCNGYHKDNLVGVSINCCSSWFSTMITTLEGYDYIFMLIICMDYCDLAFLSGGTLWPPLLVWVAT